MRARCGPAVLLLLVLCAATFWNSLPGQYCYDDTSAIRDRKTIESAEGLRLLVSRQYCPAFGELSYRPVVSLSYFVDGMLFHKSPAWSRLFNILLHAAIGACLYMLWRRLFRDQLLAILAAALFLCHPIVTEVVNCPGFREDQLALLFMVLALHVMLSAVQHPGAGRIIAASLLWFLALLSKEPAFMLVLLAPLLLLRQEYAPRGTWRLRHSVVLGVAVILAATSYAFLYRTLSWHGQNTDWPGGRGPVLGFLNFCRTFTVYLRLWILPTGLSIGHEFAPATTYADFRLWLSLAVWLAFATSAVMLFLLRSVGGTGMMWVLITMVPMMQIIPSAELLAERYAYIPHAGMSLAMAAALSGLVRLCSRSTSAEPGRELPMSISRAAQALPVLLIAGCMLLTLARNRDWSDEITLNIRRYELWKSAQGHLALGNLYFDRKDGPRAVEHLRKAIYMNPRLADGHYLLGVIYYQTGHAREARESLRRAIELKPADDKYRKALEKLESAQTSG